MLINYFYKKHIKKPVANFLQINSVLLMAKPIIMPTRPIIKQKQGQMANSGSKQAKN